MAAPVSYEINIV